jgi:hypothetical protein
MIQCTFDQARQTPFLRADFHHLAVEFVILNKDALWLSALSFAGPYIHSQFRVGDFQPV